MLPVWTFDALADALCAALEARERALRDEQAVYGLDALKELDIHALLADGMAHTGWGVLREQLYPHEWTRKQGAQANLPERRDRLRCDLVLTERHGSILDDAVLTEKRRRTERQAVEGTLFAALAPPEPERAFNATLPENALWVEIKVIAQHTLTAGVLAPNRTYAGALTRGPIADLVKLNADERIRSGAAVAVLFTHAQETARNDLTVLTHRCLDKGLPISTPQVLGFPISDRLGNSWCAVCVVGIRK